MSVTHDSHDCIFDYFDQLGKFWTDIKNKKPRCIENILVGGDNIIITANMVQDPTVAYASFHKT